MTPTQTFLPIRCQLHRPTTDLAGARLILDIHENEIKSLADTGTFPTWNIACASNGPRTERRFLVRAVRDYSESRPITRDDDLILRLLYGKEKPYILGKDFYRGWNCDSGTMINLLKSGVLQTVPGTTYSQGRGCTPCITWSSALAFFRSRRIA